MLSNKYIQLLILAVTLVITACTKDTPSDFQKESFVKTFGDAYLSEASDFISLGEGFIIMGNLTNKEGINTIYLTQTDALGNYQWQNEYAIGNSCLGQQIIARSNQNGYAIIGTVQHDTDSLYNDVLLLLLNADGSINDTLFYDFGASEEGRSLIELTNGNILLSGVSATSTTSSISERITILTDAVGQILVNPKPITASEVYRIVPMANGYLQSFTANNTTKIALINQNATEENVSLNFNGTLTRLIVNDNQEIFACGTSTNGENGRNDLVIASLTYNEVNASFAINWEKEFGNNQNDYGTDVAITESGSVIGTGYILDTQLGTYDIAVYELDTDGNVLHEKMVGGSNNEYGIKSLGVDNNKIVNLSTSYFNSTSMITLVKFGFE